MIEQNPIPWKKRIKELFIDYLVICLYLVFLLLISLMVYFFIFNGIPKFTEQQSQMIALFCSVIPIIIIFTVLDLYKGTFGKRKSGLSLYFKKKTLGSSLLRNIFKFLPWQLGHMSTIRGMYTNYDLLSIILSLLSVSLLISYILMGFFRQDKRHLPDLIAKTQVQYRIKKKPIS